MKQHVLMFHPDVALEFIAEFEQGPKGGPALQAYLCPAGVWTIGFGHTKNVHKGDTITRQEAFELLSKDLIHAHDDLAALVNIPVTENQFIALLSFVFNFGLTKCRKYRLFKMVNAENIEGVKTWWPKYCNPGSKYEDGLLRRRNAELELYLKK